MRLIDADALDAEMYRKSFEVDDGRNVWNSGLWIRYKIFEEAIRDAPTVDAEPVRHGKWNCSDDMFEYAVCPVCKWDSGEAWEYAIKRFKYCPNCGAKMDEREEE